MDNSEEIQKAFMAVNNRCSEILERLIESEKKIEILTVENFELTQNLKRLDRQLHDHVLELDAAHKI